MADGDIETYFEDGVWKNRPEGNTRASNTADTKAEAQSKGREMAKERGVEHLIVTADDLGQLDVALREDPPPDRHTRGGRRAG